jgi:PAS domain S-box-containing protein
MVTSVRKFFSFPEFLADDEKTRAARILTTIINTLSLLALLIITGGLLAGDFSLQRYAPIFPTWAIILGAQYMLQRGWVKPAGVILVLILSLGATTGIYSAGTVRSFSIIFLLLNIMVAGVVVSRQASFWTALLNTLLVFGLVQAEISGLLPPPDLASNLSLALTFAAGSLLTAVLLNLSLGQLEFSLERAHRSEQAISELAATLDDRIEERSRTLSEALRITRLGNWVYDLRKDEFTFNDDFYAMMRTTVEREGSYTMTAAEYATRFVYPEDAPLVGMEIGMAVSSTTPNYHRELSHRVIFGDGQLGYITGQLRIDSDEQGRPVKFFGANQDITEQKLAEIALTEKQAQLSEALRIAHLGNWEFDLLRGEFTFNDDFYEMMRTTAEEVGGYQLKAADYAARFVHPDDAAIVGMEIGKSVETTDPNYQAEISHRVIFGDGEMGYITVRFRIEKDAQGRTVKAFGANQDITEQKKAEIALRKFQLALERSTDAVFMTDLEGTIEYVNPAFESVYGFSPEETLGANPRLIKSGLIPQEQYTHFWHTLQQNQIIAREIINKHKDGRLVPVEAINASILDNDGHQLGYMATHRDITARKQTDATLAKRVTELETVTQLATAIASIPSAQEMLQYVSDLTKNRFDFYHAHVYLLDEADGMLELAAGAGEAGHTMVARGHAIPLSREQSLVARAARTRQGVLANDVTLAPDFLPNPLLPKTRSELAVPLVVRERVLGVLDVQAVQVNAFSEEDIRIQTILAAQIAVALENVRTNEKTTQTVAELDTLTRRLTHEGWQDYLTKTDRTHLGYMFEDNQLIPLQDGHASDKDEPFVQPVIIRGERIGQVKLSSTEHEAEELQAILAGVSQGLSAHLENLRLTEEAERRVQELRLVNEIGQVLTTEVELLPILVTVVNTIQQAFRADRVYIALYDPANQQVQIPYMLDRENPIFDDPAFPLDDGVISTLIKTRRRIFFNQDTDRRLRAFGVIPDTAPNSLSKSFIGLPLVAAERVIGVLSVQDVEREGRFTQSDVDLLTTIAANLAVAIQNTQLYAQAHKRAQRETLVNQIGQKIQGTTSVPNALRTAIQELGLALKAKKTVVKLTPPTSPTQVTENQAP